MYAMNTGTRTPSLWRDNTQQYTENMQQHSIYI